MVKEGATLRGTDVEAQPVAQRDALFHPRIYPRNSMKLKPIASKRSVVFTIQHKIHMFITLRRICLRACVVEKEQSYLKFLFFQKRPVSFLHVKSVLAGI